MYFYHDLHIWSLGALWVSVVLDPTLTFRQHPATFFSDVISRKKSGFEASKYRNEEEWGGEHRLSTLKSCLKNWSSVSVCPLEDPDIHWSSAELSETNYNHSQHHHNSATSSSSDDEMDDNPTINNLTSSSNDLISCSTPRLLKQNSLDTDEGQSSDSANEGDDLEPITDDKHTDKKKCRKRKRLTKRANCKRSRKDCCRRFLKPRTVFHKALDALKMSWKDAAIMKILQFGDIPCKCFLPPWSILIVYSHEQYYSNNCN